MSPLQPSESETGAKPKSCSTPKPAAASSASGGGEKFNDFWETLLRLDTQMSKTKGKGVARSHSSVSSLNVEDEPMPEASFQASAFGQLLGMLSAPVIRKSSLLTDKLLHLLSIISVGQSALNSSQQQVEASKDGASASASAQSPVIGASHLKLAVEVLTSKSCRSDYSDLLKALFMCAPFLSKKGKCSPFLKLIPRL